MPSRYEHSEDMPFCDCDRSPLARNIQHFEGVISDFAIETAKAEQRAFIIRWLRRALIGALIALVAAFIALTVAPKTKNTLALYHQIQTIRSAG